MASSIPVHHFAPIADALLDEPTCGSYDAVPFDADMFDWIDAVVGGRTYSEAAPIKAVRS